MSRCYAKILKSESVWMRIEFEELGQENGQYSKVYKTGMAVGFSNDGTFSYLDSFQKSYADESRIFGSYFAIIKKWKAK